MSYEKGEIIKVIILILICIPTIAILIAQEIINNIKYKKYEEELNKAQILEAEKKNKKLENLKLESLILNLNKNELEMLDSLSSLNNLSRSQILRKSIKEVIKEFEY